MKMPKTPFSTRLSGSAKETELRLRSIFQWKKKRPPVVVFILVAVVLLSCFSLFSCAIVEPQAENSSVQDDTNSDYGKTPERENETNNYPSAEEDALVALGNPLNEIGSILGVDQLFDRPCVYQEFVNVTADPDRPNHYLYTFRFFYRGDGSEYSSEGEETTLLTVHNCRKVSLSDYDNDGIVELFVQPEHEERFFELYDMENGEIISGSPNEDYLTVRFIRIMAVTEDTVMRNCYSYTYSDPMDNNTYEWYWTGTDYQLTKGDAVTVLEEIGGVSRVMIPFGDIPRLYGFVDSSLLGDGIFSAQAVIAHNVPGYAAPGDDTPVTTLVPCAVQLLEMRDKWVKVQPLGTGAEQCWVESSHLQIGFYAVTDYEAPPEGLNPVLE